MPITIKNYEEMDDFLSIVAMLNNRQIEDIHIATKSLNDRIIHLEHKVKDLEDQLAISIEKNAQLEKELSIQSCDEAIVVRDSHIENLQKEIDVLKNTLALASSNTTSNFGTLKPKVKPADPITQ